MEGGYHRANVELKAYLRDGWVLPALPVLVEESAAALGEDASETARYEHADLCHSVGWVLMDNGKYEPALAHYEMALEMLGGVPVHYSLSAENGWLPDPAAVEAAVTPRTKALLLNSPGNPTGVCCDVERLAAQGGHLRRHRPHAQGDQGLLALVGRRRAAQGQREGGGHAELHRLLRHGGGCSATNVERP